MPAETSAFFDDVVAAYTGPDFVRRRWLEDAVESAIAGDNCRYVLLTAEPGAGKTGLLADLAQRHPERPRYFIRRDSRASLTGGDVQSFLLSVGHQLASVHPELFRPELLEIEVKQKVDAVLTGGRAVGVRIDDLTVSPFYRTALLRLDQSAESVAGTMVGVEIGQVNLEPRLLEPANLAHLALIAPATALAASHPEARIVVLVDALDEIADDIGHGGLLEWLESGPELPSNVRLVLTSRTHTKLELFRRRRLDQLMELTIDPKSTAVRDDLRAYAGRVVDDDAVTAAVESQGFVPEDLVNTMATRAEGNFAYLVAYGRALVGAIERVDEEFRNRLLRFSEVPLGLDGLYGFFMESIRNDISRMGMMEVREPVSPQDLLCPAWESVGQPVLGILVVARDVLTLDQIIRLARVRVWRRDVANVIARLRQFLDTTATGMRLFHASLAEYLVSAEARAAYPEWAVEEEEWHERVALSYRDTAPAWRDVDWSTVDTYGLKHLATHVSRCRPRVADEIVDLVTPGLRWALRAAVGTDEGFLAVTDIAADYAVRRFPGSRALPSVLFLGLVARQVQSVGVGAPPGVVGLLARLGRVDEAQASVRLLQPSLQQFRGMAEIVRQAPADRVDAERREELHELLVQYATAVPAQRETLGTSLRHRREAVEVAAAWIAGVDLGRALRLCRLAETIDTAPVALGGAATDASTAVDAVYRAAALAAPAGSAAELVGRMSAGRASAFLDLAERDGADQPHRLAATLAAAEAGLASEARDSRLVCSARLAAGWAALDAGAASRQVAAVRAAALDVPPERANERGKWYATIVTAAGWVADVDPVAATEILDHIDTVPADSHNSRAILDAAKLWLCLGQPERPARLLNALLRHARSNPVHAAGVAEIAAVAADYDPHLAATLADEALRQAEPLLASTDAVNGLFRDGTLCRIALAVNRFDPPRALAVAQRLPSWEWQPHSYSTLDYDRASVLAQLASDHLDGGRADWAHQALDAALAAVALAATAAASGEDPDASPAPFAPAVAGSADRAGSGDRGVDARARPATLGYAFNTYQQWIRRVGRTVFTDPADVARSILPPPFAMGTPYGWDRVLRTMAETVAPHHLDQAVALLHRIGDDAERAIGSAGVAAWAMRAGDVDQARRLSAAATAALERLPRHGWRTDVSTVDPGSALGYLLPDLRARFEVAIRLAQASPDGVDSAALRLAYRASELCVESDRQVALMAVGDAWPAETVAWHQQHLTEVSGWDDATVRHVTAARLVANERVLRDRGTRDAAGNRIPGPPVRPLAVADTVYAGVADLLSLRAGLPTGSRLVRSIQDLLVGKQPAAAVQLAAWTAGALTTKDTTTKGTTTNDTTAGDHDDRPDDHGDVIRSLLAQAVEVARGQADAFVRALAFAQLATPASLDPFADRDELVAEAMRDIDDLGELERGELLAVLFPLMISRRPEQAARLLLSELRTRWREAMALLEWAAPAVVDHYGVEVVMDLDQAVGRAHDFAGASSTMDDRRAGTTATPGTGSIGRAAEQMGG